MRFTSTARVARRTLAGTLALVMAMGCRDAQEPGSEPVNPPPPPPQLSALIVSNPDVSGIVYASLPQGSYPNGERIVVQTRRTGALGTAALFAGGFDPVRVAARAGDTLDLRLYLFGSGEVIKYFSVVPAHRSPVLVITDPAPGRRDVLPNTVLRLVFSEPINPATLTASSVRLFQGGVPVAGTLAFTDAAHLTVTFTPAGPLASGTDYTLGVTPAIEDLDGEPLETPLAIPFVTRRALSPVAAIYERVTPHYLPGYHTRFVLDDQGAFELQYETLTWGNFVYAGQYQLTGSTITFEFDGWNTAGPWEASGTLLGDSLVVEYNIVMQLSDFEDGVYVRFEGTEASRRN